MELDQLDFKRNAESYLESLRSSVTEAVMGDIMNFSIDIAKTIEACKRIYICGNGGSAANAIHIANDFIYGAAVGKSRVTSGARVEALSSNSAVLTCLANDLDYKYIFSEQIRVKGESGDMLVCLSGSGNSQNILEAISIATDIGMSSWSIVGYDGGAAKTMSSRSIHFEIDDMQIAEDAQLLAAHLCMQWLSRSGFFKGS